MPSVKGAVTNPSFWKLVWHLPKMLRLTLRLLKDGRVPLIGKLAFFAACAYTVSPVDLVPDFILPVLGYADDVALLLAALRFMLKLTPPNVLEEHLGELDMRTLP